MTETLLVIDADVMHRMGGMVRHVCVGMMDEAVRVTVLSRARPGQTDPEVGLVRVVRVPSMRWPWARPSADTLLQAVGGRKPNIVHCMSADLAAWMAPFCGAWGCTLVAQLSDLHDATRFARLSRHRPVIGVAMTAAVQRALAEEAPELRARVHLVPAGLPAESEAVALSDPKRIPSAVMTMPLTKNCGLAVVLKSLKMLVKAGREIQLFVLSTGWAESRYRRLVQELELRRYVTFAGTLHDWTVLRRAMLAADFYIATGATERFDISGLTALAGGMIILAPRNALEDYLIDGQTAIRFDSGSPRQLAQKWSALLDDRDHARSLAWNALEYARAHHQASTMVTQLAALYRRLCDSHENVAASSSS